MNLTCRGIPVVGFVAASGTGKTTLLRALIPLLRRDGLRVACVKHTHHPFEIDRPGKDSYVLREAGAQQVLIGSPRRWALIVEGDGADPTLDVLVARLALETLDLVLVEGFKLETVPKIEVHRRELGAELLCHSEPTIIAVASNQRPLPRLAVPVFDLDAPAAVATFLRAHVERCAGLRGPAAGA